MARTSVAGVLTLLVGASMGAGQLEDALHLSAQDLKYASSTIQADLDRFQRQKVADLREMAISMARAHRDWCKQNLEAWEDAKREIARIPDHPNRAPLAEQPQVGSPVPGAGAAGAGAGAGVGVGVGGSAARRDSTATINGR